MIALCLAIVILLLIVLVIRNISAMMIEDDENCYGNDEHIIKELQKEEREKQQ